MSMDNIANRCGEWLRGTGPESDIVMSSRIRLARNLAILLFVAAMISTKPILNRPFVND